MKILIILSFLLFQITVFGQNSENQKDDVIFAVVETQANFPGGNNVFQKLLQTNFDSSVIDCDSTGIQSTMIEFVVEKDGTLSNIKASGSNHSINIEAIRTVKSIKTKWNPGIYKNEKVRMRFQQPFRLMCS